MKGTSNLNTGGLRHLFGANHDLADIGKMKQSVTVCVCVCVVCAHIRTSLQISAGIILSCGNTVGWNCAPGIRKMGHKYMMSHE